MFVWFSFIWLAFINVTMDVFWWTNRWNDRFRTLSEILFRLLWRPPAGWGPSQPNSPPSLRSIKWSWAWNCHLRWERITWVESPAPPPPSRLHPVWTVWNCRGGSWSCRRSCHISKENRRTSHPSPTTVISTQSRSCRWLMQPGLRGSQTVSDASRDQKNVTARLSCYFLYFWIIWLEKWGKNWTLKTPSNEKSPSLNPVSVC